MSLSGFILLLSRLSFIDTRQRNGDTFETRICPRIDVPDCRCGFSRTVSQEAVLVMLDERRFYHKMVKDRGTGTHSKPEYVPDYRAV